MMVAPVVVKPEMDSKTASVRLQPNPILKGKAPTSPSRTQKRVTTRKPSRTDSSCCARQFGSQSRQPATRVKINDMSKTPAWPSP